MNKFLYQIDKKEIEGGIELSLYYIDDKKESILEKKVIPYQILAKKVDFESLKIESDQIFLAERNFKDINGENIVKIEIKDRELKDFILNSLKEIDSMPYEADLPVEHRYLIDNEIELLEGDSDYIGLKYLSVDIETIGEKNSQEIVLISSFSPFDKSFNKVFCAFDKIIDKNKAKLEKYKGKEFELVICSDEKEMLEKFKECVIKSNSQAIVGWNVIDFDFKVIKERMDALSVPYHFSKYEGESKLRIFNDFFKNSTLTMPGCLVFDIINVLKMNFIDFEDYKLNTVAKEVLSDEKIDLEDDGTASESIDDKISAISHMLEKDPIKLIEYNFKDSVLTSQIMEKLNLVELICKRSITTGTPLSRIKSPIATLDIMYLKKLHKQGFVAPSNFNYSDSTSIEGAFVINPEKGFYDDVFVLDFKSLYPSIIMTFNLDPFTYYKDGDSERREVRGDESKNRKLIEAPNGAKFVSEPGILPELILQLYKARDVAKSEKDDVKSFVLKITMNSFYGAVASPKSRFYNHEIGEAITGFGRFIIQKAKKFIEDNGEEVIYGDTDSIFVKANKEFKSFDEKIKFGKELEIKIDKFFSAWVAKEFGTKNYLNIEFEKLFSKFFIATKKRYVGYDDFTKKKQFVGMEAIRGDWTNLAKDFQIEIVDLIFSGKKKEEISKYILDYVEKLKSGAFDSKLIYTKKITKPLNQYTKITPPHVRAAREVEGFSGRIVKYVLTKDGPKHVKLIEKLRDEKGDGAIEYDYDNYIDKQLKGVSDDLLGAIDIDFDEVLFRKKQSSLNKFF